MLTNGQHINHYQVLSVIGASGMGEVYLAENTSTTVKYAQYPTFLSTFNLITC